MFQPMVCFKLNIYASAVSNFFKPGYKTIISWPEEVFVTKLKILLHVLVTRHIWINNIKLVFFCDDLDYGKNGRVGNGGLGNKLVGNGYLGKEKIQK